MEENEKKTNIEMSDSKVESSKEKGAKSAEVSKTRQIIDIVVTSVQVVIVLACIALSIIVWTGSAGDPINRKINWFAIRTDSMTKQVDAYYENFEFNKGVSINAKKTTFNPGDMVITKKVAFDDIKIGDVIAYKATIPDINGNISEQIITHRVVDINKDTLLITTQGDKDINGEQQTSVYYKDVYGKMTGKLKGVGSIVLWLQGFRKKTVGDTVAYDRDETNKGSSASFLIIIIPLAALFIYNGFYVVKWVMDEKSKKIKEQAAKEAAEQAAKSAVDKEEIERKAIRSYMMANGMTEEQIDAFFAMEDAKKKAAEEPTPDDGNSSGVVESPQTPSEPNQD